MRKSRLRAVLIREEVNNEPVFVIQCLEIDMVARAGTFEKAKQKFIRLCRFHHQVGALAIPAPRIFFDLYSRDAMNYDRDIIMENVYIDESVHLSIAIRTN